MEYLDLFQSHLQTVTIILSVAGGAVALIVFFASIWHSGHVAKKATEYFTNKKVEEIIEAHIDKKFVPYVNKHFSKKDVIKEIINGLHEKIRDDEKAAENNTDEKDGDKADDNFKEGLDKYNKANR